LALRLATNGSAVSGVTIRCWSDAALSDAGCAVTIDGQHTSANEASAIAARGTEHRPDSGEFNLFLRKNPFIEDDYAREVHFAD
jgi:hypothetical protein